MKVILKQDVYRLGAVGDEITVKPGYARNFLIPQGLAVAVHKSNEKALAHQRKLIEEKRNEAIKSSRELADRIKQTSLVIAMPSAKNGKLFGSVTTKVIIEELAKQGLQLEKKYIHMGTTIKTIGTHKVPLMVHSQVKVELEVKVVSDSPVEEKPAPKAKEESTEATEETANTKEA